MADTIRTRAALEALLADNTAGDISAQDLRDVLKSTQVVSKLDKIVTVATSGGDYTSIQSAINSISDAAIDKIYTVLVYSGEYDEAITLSNYVNIVAIDPEATKILQQVSDNNVECNCYLNINIESVSGYGLYTQHANTVITMDGDISSSNDIGLNCYGGILTISGNISSSAERGVNCAGGTLTIKNNTITTTYNDVTGHAIAKVGGTLILQNVKIICTHVNVKSITAPIAQDVYCMSVWANRDDSADITQMIAGGFNFDANVQ